MLQEIHILTRMRYRFFGEDEPGLLQLVELAA